MNGMVFQRMRAIALWIGLFGLLAQAGVPAMEPPATNLSANEAKASLAVLDFQAPPDAPFLGPAIAQALVSKLTGVEGLNLLERSEIQCVLAAANGTQDPSPQLLRARFLLVGQVMLSGRWPEPECKVRIVGRMLQAGSGAVAGETSFVRDGTVADWFALEDELALWTATATGRQIGRLQASLSDSRTLDAERFYGLALISLSRAEQEARAGRYAEALSYYQSAIDSARNALNNNAESFFAGAHSLEQRAREGLALMQEKMGGPAQQTRQQTVRQFTQDAATAAVAFFDLARARQASGDYPGALAGYQDYLDWSARTARSFMGRQPALGGLYGEDAPGWYDNGVAAQSNALTPFVLEGGQIFYLAGADELVCASSDFTREFWRIPCPGKHWRCLIARPGTLYMATDDKQVLSLDRASGEILRRLRIPHQGDDNSFWRLYVFPESNRLIAIGSGIYGFPLTTPTAGEDAAYAIRSLAQTGTGDFAVPPTAFVQTGGRLFFLQERKKRIVLFEVNPVNGEQSIRAEIPNSVTYYSTGTLRLWPGDDHLLLWWKFDTRDFKEEKAYRYFLRDGRREEVTQPLLGEYVLRNRPGDSAQVPLIDRRTGRYRLLPAKLLLPFTSGSDLVGSTGEPVVERLPGVRLAGDQLWITSRSVACLFHSGTEQLLWKKRIAGLQNGLEPDGMNAFLQTAQGMERHQAIFTLSDRMVEKATVQMAECHQALGQTAQAQACVEKALQENGSNPDALSLRGDLAAGVGDLAQALAAYEQTLWYASRGSAPYTRAVAWLRKHAGLLGCEYAGNITRFEGTENGVWVASSHEGNETLRYYDVQAGAWGSNTVDAPGVWSAGGDRLLGIADSKRVAELTGQPASQAPAGLYEVQLPPPGQTGPKPRLIAGLDKLPDSAARSALLTTQDQRQILVIYDKTQVQGYDPATGKQQWTLPVRELLGATYYNNALFLVSRDPRSIGLVLTAFKPSGEGGVLWSAKLPRRQFSSSEKMLVNLGADSAGVTVVMTDQANPDNNVGWQMDTAGRVLGNGPILSGIGVPERTEGLLTADVAILKDFLRPQTVTVSSTATMTGNGAWGAHLVLESGLLSPSAVDRRARVTAADLREDDPRRLARLQYFDFLRGCWSREEQARRINQRLENPGPAEIAFFNQMRWRIMDLPARNDRTLDTLQAEVMTQAPQCTDARLRLLLSYAGGRPGEDSLLYPPEKQPVCRQDFSIPLPPEQKQRWRLGASAHGDYPGLSLLDSEQGNMSFLPPRLALPLGGCIVRMQLCGSRLYLTNSAGFLYAFDWPVLCRLLVGQVVHQGACFASAPVAVNGDLPAILRDCLSPGDVPDKAPALSATLHRSFDRGQEEKAGGELPLKQGDFVGMDYAFGQWMAGVRIRIPRAVADGTLLAEVSDRSENGWQTVALEMKELQEGWNTLTFPKPFYGRFWRIYCAGASAPPIEALAFTPYVFQPPQASSGTDAPAPWTHRCRYTAGKSKVIVSAGCSLPLLKTEDRCRVDSSGFHDVAQAGEYELTLWLAGEARLTVDGNEVLPLTGSPGWHVMRQRVRLAAGRHTLTLQYTQTGRYRGFALTCTEPAGLIEDYYRSDP